MDGGLTKQIYFRSCITNYAVSQRDTLARPLIPNKNIPIVNPINTAVYSEKGRGLEPKEIPPPPHRITRAKATPIQKFQEHVQRCTQNQAYPALCPFDQILLHDTPHSTYYARHRHVPVVFSLYTP